MIGGIGEKRAESSMPHRIASAIAWGLFEPLVVVPEAVFVVGPTTKGVIGKLEVLGWAIPVVLFVFVGGGG